MYQAGQYLDAAEKTGALLLVHLLLVPDGDRQAVVLAEVSRVRWKKEHNDEFNCP